MSFKQNNPLSRKTSPINRDWIKGAIKRPGAFRKKAEESGMSTKAFAEKVTANKEDYSARTGKQAELAETLMGMSRHKSGHKNPEQGDFDYEDPNYRDTPEYKKFQRKQKRKNKKNKPKRGEAGFEQDEQEAYYENKSDKMDKKKGVSRQSAATKPSKGGASHMAEMRKKNVKKKPVNKEALAKRKKIIAKVRKKGEAKISAGVSRKSNIYGDWMNAKKSRELDKTIVTGMDSSNKKASAAFKPGGMGIAEGTKQLAKVAKDKTDLYNQTFDREKLYPKGTSTYLTGSPSKNGSVAGMGVKESSSGELERFKNETSPGNITRKSSKSSGPSRKNCKYKK